MRSFFFGAALLALTALHVAAHPADIGHLRVDISRQQVAVRLTFNLATLQRFVEMDSDQNGSISHAELSAAIPKVEDILGKQVLISINDTDTDLGPSKPFRCVWPDPDSDVPVAEYLGRYVDLFFLRDWTSVVEDIWIGFDFFHGPNDLLTIQGLYQQEEHTTEVEFSALEPEFLYDTGYTASEATALDQEHDQLAEEVFTRPALRLTFACLALLTVVSVFIRLRRMRRNS
ncbi:MAG: hypothetical protein KDK97_09075 [Verrucomicrobiales bacterium]|nr:hypothetical protein [Verrucomicrobiales bacterium]MCP5557833.1 hypothetical protein [Verrucomicrobiaceae bacterium]